MIKLGKTNKNKKNQLTKIGFESLYLREPDLFTVDVIIGGNEYVLDLYSILKSLKKPEELSDNEISNMVESISSYQFTIYVINSELRELKSNLEDDYKIWFSDVSLAINRNIRKGIIEVNKRPSKEDILNQILNNEEYKIEWVKRRNLIKIVDKRLIIIDGLVWILKDRLKSLEYIGNKRQLIKKNRGYNSSI